MTTRLLERIQSTTPSPSPSPIYRDHHWSNKTSASWYKGNDVQQHRTIAPKVSKVPKVPPKDQLETEDIDDIDDEVDILSDHDGEGPFTVFSGMDLSRLIYQATEEPPLRSSVEFDDDAPIELIDTSSSLPLQAETMATTLSPTTIPPTTTMDPRESSGTESSSLESVAGTSTVKSSSEEEGMMTTLSAAAITDTTTVAATTESGSVTVTPSPTTTESINNDSDQGFEANEDDDDDEKSSLSNILNLVNGKKSNPVKNGSNPFSTKGQRIKVSKSTAPLPTRSQADVSKSSKAANVETEDSDSFESVDPRSIGGQGIKGSNSGVKGGMKGGRSSDDGTTTIRGNVPSFLPRSRRYRIRTVNEEDHDLVSVSRFNSPRIRQYHSLSLSESGRRKKKSASRTRNSYSRDRTYTRIKDGTRGERKKKNYSTRGSSSRNSSNKKRNIQSSSSNVRTFRLEPLPDNLDLGYSDIPIRSSRHRRVEIVVPKNSLPSPVESSFHQGSRTSSSGSR